MTWKKIYKQNESHCSVYIWHQLTERITLVDRQHEGTLFNGVKLVLMEAFVQGMTIHYLTGAITNPSSTDKLHA